MAKLYFNFGAMGCGKTRDLIKVWYNYKEKGLVVFVKDMEDGNYFTWKLVRFDKYRLGSE